VTLARRGDDLLVQRIEDLRVAWRQTARAMPFRCDAIVVLPDHLHAVWTLPPGDGDFSTRWKMFKAGFTQVTGLSGPRSDSKRTKGERGIWQRRFWEHTIRDEADFVAHVAYCWGNPVKHGLVARAAEWPYSSIHRDIRAGRVSPEWSGGLADGQFGE
jgi:putative transposase